MSTITAALVNTLRQQTGAGMMNCKQALEATAGDVEKAVDWLREKGLASAAKKAGRIASEGLVSAAVTGNKGVVVEINSETDFVARNENFQQLVKQVTDVALAKAPTDAEALATETLPSGRSVADEITHLVAVIGENMRLRRAATLQVTQGLVTHYTHNAVVPGAGKIGVLVALESSAPAEALATVAKQIAMHIAAARPAVLAIADVDPQLLARERAIYTEQAKASGKPDNIIEKMVDGRVRKYYEEIVLLEQVFIMDDKLKIAQVIEDLAKTVGAPVRLGGFVRFELGEGIEQEEKDFASEVAAIAGTK
jgi:elongation factor Ts